jgi:hypothetical protein
MLRPPQDGKGHIALNESKFTDSIDRDCRGAWVRPPFITLKTQTIGLRCLIVNSLQHLLTYS